MWYVVAGVSLLLTFGFLFLLLRATRPEEVEDGYRDEEAVRKALDAGSLTLDEARGLKDLDGRYLLPLTYFPRPAVSRVGLEVISFTTGQPLSSDKEDEMVNEIMARRRDKG